MATTRTKRPYRVMVKFIGEKPQAMEYKHLDGAMTFAQDRSLQTAKNFEKVTVTDLLENRVVYSYGFKLIGWKYE